MYCTPWGVQITRVSRNPVSYHRSTIQISIYTARYARAPSSSSPTIHSRIVDFREKRVRIKRINSRIPAASSASDEKPSEESSLQRRTKKKTCIRYSAAHKRSAQVPAPREFRVSERLLAPHCPRNFSYFSGARVRGNSLPQRGPHYVSVISRIARVFNFSAQRGPRKVCWRPSSLLAAFAALI